MNTREAAIRYLEQGFSVIPIRPGDKRPLIAWEPYQKARASAQQVEKWWDENPDANVAIVTGEVSGVDVIDLDGKEGIDNFGHWMMSKGLANIYENGAKSMMARTPSGGIHIYIPALGKGNAVGWVENVDYRGTGGYVVAPPSVLADGRKYRWAPPAAQSTRSLKSILQQPIAESFVQSLNSSLICNNSITRQSNIELCNNSIYREPLLGQNGSGVKLNAEECGRMGDVSLYKSIKPNLTASKGTRNETMFSLANRLIFLGMEVAEAFNYLCVINKNFDPPLPEQEVWNILQSSIKRRGQRLIDKDPVDPNMTPERPQIDPRLTPDDPRRPQMTPGGLSQSDIDTWIEENSGEFTLVSLYNELGVNDAKGKKLLRKYIARTVGRGKVKKVPGNQGRYRIVNTELKITKVGRKRPDPVNIWLPFGLTEERGIRVYPQTLIILAGETNMGKTTFLMLVAYKNLLAGRNVRYLDAEMGDDEFTERIYGFDRPIEEWSIGDKFLPVNCTGQNDKDFADKLDTRPGAINIIDYLSIHDKHYKIGEKLEEIQSEAGQSVVIVALQKDPASEFGRGGSATAELSRLYITLSKPEEDAPGRVMFIKKAKFFDRSLPNPNGTKIRYFCTDADMDIYEESHFDPTAQDQHKPGRIQTPFGFEGR